MARQLGSNTTCAPVTVTAETFAYITPVCAFSPLSITFALMCPLVKFIFCVIQLKLYQLLYLLTICWGKLIMHSISLIM